jgi:hypothetical protein
MTHIQSLYREFDPKPRAQPTVTDQARDQIVLCFKFMTRIQSLYREIDPKAAGAHNRFRPGTCPVRISEF